MFAVIETGGKQYRVEEGDVIDVELLGNTDDEEVSFDRVLLVGNGDDLSVGAPVLDGASVTGELVGEVRGPKIKVYKKKRRKGYERTRGHRQNHHRVRISAISA